MSFRTPPHGACPSPGQWNGLLAHRFEADRDEPEGWNRALAHLDECASCRQVATDRDPTLLFHRLAAPAPLLDPGAEVAAMQQAVAAMRRAERIERTEQRTRGGMWTSGARWAAAAAVALATLSLGAGLWNDGLWQKGPGAEGSLAAGLGAAPSSLDPAVANALDEIPAIEEPFGTPESASVEDSRSWQIWELDAATVILADGPEEMQGV